MRTAAVVAASPRSYPHRPSKLLSRFRLYGNAFTHLKSASVNLVLCTRLVLRAESSKGQQLAFLEVKMGLLRGYNTLCHPPRKSSDSVQERQSSPRCPSYQYAGHDLVW